MEYAPPTLTRTQREAEFAETFDKLSDLFRPHTRTLAVKADSNRHLYLDCPVEVRPGYPHFLGAVAVMKAYVSFHFMPMYSDPELLAPLSDGLRARMQGKSCFNFKSINEAQLAELRGLVERGIALYKGRGLILA